MDDSIDKISSQIVTFHLARRLEHHRGTLWHIQNQVVVLDQVQIWDGWDGEEWRLSTLVSLKAEPLASKSLPAHLEVEGGGWGGPWEDVVRILKQGLCVWSFQEDLNAKCGNWIWFEPWDKRVWTGGWSSCCIRTSFPGRPIFSVKSCRWTGRKECSALASPPAQKN